MADLFKGTLLGRAKSAETMAEHPVFWSAAKRGEYLANRGNELYDGSTAGPITSRTVPNSQELYDELYPYFPGKKLWIAVSGTYADVLILISHGRRHFQQWVQQGHATGSQDNMLARVGTCMGQLTATCWWYTDVTD